MSLMGNVIHLQNYENFWGEKPGDYLGFIRRGTMVGGELEVDLSKEVRKGAKVSVVPLAVMTTDSSTGKITAANAIGDTDEVDVLVIVNVADLAPSSQLFGG